MALDRRRLETRLDHNDQLIATQTKDFTQIFGHQK